MPSALYAVAFNYIIKNEGQTFVDDPRDRGGACKYGITIISLQSYYNAIGLKKTATVNDIKALTLITVAPVYELLYWKPVRGDEYTQPGAAIAMMDIAVLCGVPRAVRMAQKAVQVVVDGLLGPKTMAAINADTVRNFLLDLNDAQQEYLLDIVLNDPTQKAFYQTWRRRAADHLALAIPA